MNAHVRHEDSDDEDKRQVWTAVRRGRKDSGSSYSGDSDDSTNSSGSSESEQFDDSDDEDDGKKRREQIYEKIAALEEELAELRQSYDETDKPHPTDG